MPSFKKYVPRFSSQSDSSQRNESHPHHQTAGWAEASSQSPGAKRGWRRDVTRTRPILKVRLLEKFTDRTALDREPSEDKTPVGVTQRPPATKTNRPGEPGREIQSPLTNSAPVDQSVFFFSQESSVKVKNEKERTKLAVLRTISRMLEENELIRQRLVLLTQAN